MYLKYELDLCKLYFLFLLIYKILKIFSMVFCLLTVFMQFKCL